MPMPNCDLSFTDLVTAYSQVQDNLTAEIATLSNDMANAQPGKFLLLQFKMSKVAQVGASISNLIAQVQSIIMTSIRAQKGQ